jgi:hypothetical protein
MATNPLIRINLSWPRNTFALGIPDASWVFPDTVFICFVTQPNLANLDA